MFELKLQDATKPRHPVVRKRIPSEAIQVIKSNIPNTVSTPVPSGRLVKSTPKLKPGENPVVVSTNYNSSYQQLRVLCTLKLLDIMSPPHAAFNGIGGGKKTRIFQYLSN
ncbi:unnamed protein product [Rodentolepis nana]|uniref:Uncharacterized protein n=1 Tax=Rodentolepis nana TaxID=102285 RepID=A0A0R3TI82_RODNA|nr:unnamed protein product [Rodentolepis nana]